MNKTCYVFIFAQADGKFHVRYLSDGNPTHQFRKVAPAKLHEASGDNFEDAVSKAKASAHHHRRFE